MQSNKPFFPTIKNIVFVFLPLLVAMLLQYVVLIADLVVIFIINMASDERSVSSRDIGTIIGEDYNQPMNMAYISLFQFAFFILVFGIWYRRTYGAKLTFSKSFIPTGIILIFAGYFGQLFIDGVLALCRPAFPSIFADYDKLVSNVTGANSSFVMLLALFVVAPIAEELLFRGLIYNYAARCMPVFLSIILQGLLFGLYHGNIVQGIYAFIMGCLLGYLAYRFHSILPCIILHMAINISMALVPAKLFATIGISVVTTVVSLVALVLLIYFAIRQRTEN